MVFLFPFQVMSELGSLERTLGSMHSWPRDILSYLFLVEPTNFTLLELAAFLFGNRIELLQATYFLLECFSPSQDHTDHLAFVRFKYDFVGTVSRRLTFIRIL